MKKSLWFGFCFLFFSMIFTSCTSMVVPSGFVSEKSVDFIIPELGVENTVAIGDSILREGKTVTQDVIMLHSSFGTENFGAHHPTGEYCLIGEKDGSMIYQFNKSFGTGWGFAYPQLIEESDGIIYRKTLSGQVELQSTDYKKEQVTKDDSDAYEQSLIYTGSDGTILKFTYREFINDMARAAFTIDATYNTSKDKILRFKSVVLEVIDFDNQSITYKLISGFKN